MNKCVPDFEARDRALWLLRGVDVELDEIRDRGGQNFREELLWRSEVLWRLLRVELVTDACGVLGIEERLLCEWQGRDVEDEEDDEVERVAAPLSFELEVAESENNGAAGTLKRRRFRGRELYNKLQNPGNGVVFSGLQPSRVFEPGRVELSVARVASSSSQIEPGSSQLDLTMAPLESWRLRSTRAKLEFGSARLESV